MKRIPRLSGKFKRDYKREKTSGRHGKTFDADLRKVLELLSVDAKLPRHYSDHSLSGNWSDHRDCHIKPDLILIYRKTDDGFLDLVRLGTHSELDL